MLARSRPPFLARSVALALSSAVAWLGVVAATGARASALSAVEWSPVGPEGGGPSTLAVDPHDPDTVYAGTSNDGVYRSVDGGVSWDPLGDGPPDQIKSIAIDPSAPGTAYAAGIAGA